MKKITIIILFCLFLLPSITNAGDLTYSNSENHYSFSVPLGWIGISKTAMEIMKQLVSQAGDISINYITGFQLDNVPNFQYPYILIQEHKVDTPSYNQIIKTFFDSNKTSEIINKVTDEYSEIISNASLQNPFVDKERNIVFMNMEMDVTNIGRIKGLMAMFLGKENIIQLNFYSVKSEYSENLLIFNQIIDSFRYEQGYRYNEKEAKKNNTDIFDFGKVITRTITSVIVFGFIILIFEFFQYFKKKGTKKEQKRIKTSLERKINRQKTFNYYRFKYWWRRLHRIIMSQKKYFIVGILVLCFIFAIIIYLGYSNTKGTPGIYLDSDLPPLKLPKLPKL